MVEDLGSKSGKARFLLLRDSTQMAKLQKELCTYYLKIQASNYL